MKATMLRVLSRITGISTPFGGVSFQPGEPERSVAERVVTYLEDRRVIEPDHLEMNISMPMYSHGSVHDIRSYLGKEMQAIPRDTELFKILGRMRATCRDCMSKLETTEITTGGVNQRLSTEGLVIDALSTFRAQMGISLALLSSLFDIEVNERLFKILRPDEIDVSDL